MWVKILAGLTAALAVVGVGIYVALPAGDCCHGKSNESATNSCCLSQPNLVAVETSSGCCVDEAVCCSASKAPNTDALAACTGGMAVSPAPQTTTKLKFACCGE